MGQPDIFVTHLRIWQRLRIVVAIGVVVSIAVFVFVELVISDKAATDVDLQILTYVCTCMYIWTYVCMYVCMSVCLYVCMSVCMSIFMCACMSAHKFTSMCTLLHASMHLRVAFVVVIVVDGPGSALCWSTHNPIIADASGGPCASGCEHIWPEHGDTVANLHACAHGATWVRTCAHTLAFNMRALTS